jgi:hypothetical protein
MCPTATSPFSFASAHPFAAGRTGSKVIFKQVGCNAKPVVAVCGDFKLARANRFDRVDPHEPPYTPLANIEACLLQRDRHARTAIAAETEAICSRICASAFMSPRDRRLVGRARHDR